jgi:hypothetical protein
MMFMIPIPPTKSEIAATVAGRTDIVENLGFSAVGVVK